MMNNVFQSHIVKTPLGDMTAIANDHHLVFLEFNDSKNFEQKLTKLKRQCDIVKTTSGNAIITMHFNGQLHNFKTPIQMIGTDFQQATWKELCAISYGQTRSYKNQAISMNKPTAIRAVANANGMNQIAILIPCHRIIGSNGALTGYAGGVERKEWLIDHEQVN